jgi:hypothetical protein
MREAGEMDALGVLSNPPEALRRFLGLTEAALNRL